MWQTNTHRELNAKLDGVLGDKAAKEFDAMGVTTIGDLIRHIPRRYYTTTESSTLADLVEGEDAAVFARVRRCERKVSHRTGDVRLIVTVTDGSANLPLTFFGKSWMIDYWEEKLQVGERGFFAGKVKFFMNEPQMSHPDFVILDEDGKFKAGADRNVSMASAATGSPLVGHYPATRKLPTWRIADAIRLVLEMRAPFGDPLPEWIRAEAGVMDFDEAVNAVHRPTDRESAERGIQRLLFDEVFALMATMAYRRKAAELIPATPRPRRDDGLLAAFDSRLPFTLTDGQRAVGEELFTDLTKEWPMQRLLQGEVGSGKTLVALRAMLTVVDSGGQAVLLAPTEVLAQQHHATISEQLGDLGQGGTLAGAENATAVTLLSGSMPAAQKKQAMLKIASGEAGIVVGTHALLTDRVQFADLGLVVVDEQHRFGVEQRAALDAKALTRPHVLAMTATPIPRTIAMTMFGDLEVSTLTQIPAGRQAVTTTVVDEKQHPAWVDRAWQRIGEEVAQGRQAFVVCSRISEKDRTFSEIVNSADVAGIKPRTVEQLAAELVDGPLKGLKVEALHGKVPPVEAADIMGRFAAGEIDVLVSTTVIEVGVDVPNASMMVISDADRFGISQLHQLRGRIGRGEHPGVCLLLTRVDPDTDSAVRLAEVASTTDGFDLADADLRQRREGDVLGASQSGGRSGLRLVRVTEHEDLLLAVRPLARKCVEVDPDLSDPGVADAVHTIDENARGAWLERS